MSRRARARALRATILLACAAAPAGCSIVTALTDLDSAYDAGDVDVDASAGSDARPSDGGAATEDDHVDASLCEGDAHDLCDDFDTLPLGDPSMWTTSRAATEGAVIELATDVSFSSPRALSVTTPTSGDDPRASLERALPGPATAIDCAFQLRAEALDDRGLVLPFFLTFTPPPATGWAKSSVELRIVADALDLRVNASHSDGGIAFALQRNLGPPVRSQWLAARFRVSGLDASPRLQIWLGGNVALDEAVTLPPISEVDVQIGAVVSMPGTRPWRTLFDDVVCDVTRP